MATKTDSNAEGCVEQRKILAYSGRAMVRGLRRRTTMLRIMLGLENMPRRVGHGAD